MLPPKIEDKLKRRIEALEAWRFAKIADIPLDMAETMEHFRKPPEYLKFQPAPLGTPWGRHWGTAWFRGAITIPRTCKGRKVFYRHLSFSDKLLHVDGEPFAALNPRHPEVMLLRAARGGECYSIYIEAYVGHLIPGADAYQRKPFTHQFCDMDPGKDPPLLLEASELLAEREQATALYYEASVLFRTAMTLGGDSLRRIRILQSLNAAMDQIPMHWETEEELGTQARAARKLLQPLLACKNSPTVPTAGVVGHAHIDIGWLWPVNESIRKAAKTFATALNLMEEYPEFRFVQSQPVLCDMIQTHYPGLLPRIRKRVKEGRWEPNGGMWVEADCNVPSGESLVRQFLEGRKKTQELFGYRGDTLWLPDVFGYSAALPQILRLCDINSFVTSKINWNDTNDFPYDTFWWRGIDGTEVLAHFVSTPCTLGGYNAQIFPETLHTTWQEVQRKDAQDSILISAGWGDGGGGPTREMCEHAARMKDLEGCIKTEFTSVSAYMKHLHEQDVPRPKWVGELYLELHRGTYTTQALVKKYNRKLEFLFRETELFCAMAMPHGLAWPGEALQQHWRTFLTNQFHDILPGTAIHEVYEVAHEEYASLTHALTALRDEALQTLGGQLVPDQQGAAVLVANALSWPRQEVAFLPAAEFDSACDIDGQPLACQRVEQHLAVEAHCPALGLTAIALRKGAGETASPFVYTGKSLETPFYSAAFDKAGKFFALFDKEAHRELVRDGKRLNDFYTAEDVPVFWDAWDIERYYREHLNTEDRLISREILSDGPLMLVLRSEWQIGRASTLRQDMIFYARHKRIDFRTRVDWREKQTLLKVGFGLNVHADSYRSEIQFGHVTRPLHENTSWDQARFEKCTHKWIDVSESDYGVAVLNDCKYGHDTLDDMLSLTLLRAPLAPDGTADQGIHEFTYALLPHGDAFSVESVVREAYALNLPLLCLHQKEKTGGEARRFELFQLSNPNVVVASIKKSESDDSLIIRCYEAGHTRGWATMTFTQPVRKASECNLMEEHEQPVQVTGEKVLFRVQPFEIKTLRVYLR